MSIINLIDIEDEIKNILINDSRSNRLDSRELNVDVEADFTFLTTRSPWIGIFLDSFITPQEEERIGGGAQFRTTLTIELQLVEFGMTNRIGAERRDDMYQKVKEVLKGKRSLNSKVDIFWFGAGEFTNAKADKGGFFKGVNLQLICEVTE